MMISPEMYISQIRDKPYPYLMDARNKLLRYICDFEEKEKAGIRDESEWNGSPSPEVRYQMNLEYLSGLCKLMQERYNEEYVWGRRTLKQDAEEQGGWTTSCLSVLRKSWRLTAGRRERTD